MRWSVIPFEQLKAIDWGCHGFARALAKCIQDGNAPDIYIIRVAPEGHTPRWYVEIRADNYRQQFIVDMTRFETMAAIVPIYLVDHVQSVREELKAIFEIDGFEEGVDMVIPFQRTYKGEKPS
jgi:hypothetical protein